MLFEFKDAMMKNLLVMNHLVLVLDAIFFFFFNSIVTTLEMRDSKCSSPYKENRQLLSYKGSCVISVKVDHGRQREGRKDGTFNTMCNFLIKS